MFSAHRMASAGLAIILGVSTGLGQPKPNFEVASVRPNVSGSTDSAIRPGLGDSSSATNATVRMLILSAYRLHRTQLVGGPEWLDTERFDITAKHAPGTTAAQIPLLWQSLLEDRFKLRVRTERQPRSVYRLVLARKDGRLGPNLARSAADCAATDAARLSGPVLVPATGARIPCNQRGSLMQDGQGIVSIAGRSITVLAELLTLVAGQGRIVVDRTGLSGAFDAELQWHDEPMRGGISRVPADERLSVFTAIQEQLWLRLESTTEPVDVLVVEAVERPTPD